MNNEAVVACLVCDALHRMPPLPDRTVARCRRCGAVLGAFRRNSVEAVFALSVAALIMFGVANRYPFMSLELAGQLRHSTLATGALQLWQQGHAALATLVFFTTIVAPGLQAALMLYVAAPVAMGRLPWAAAGVFRATGLLRPWAMAEVFLLGVIVSVVKLDDIAVVIPGTALWGLAALVLLLASSAVLLDPRDLWARLERNA